MWRHGNPHTPCWREGKWHRRGEGQPRSPSKGSTGCQHRVRQPPSWVRAPETPAQCARRGLCTRVHGQQRSPRQPTRAQTLSADRSLTETRRVRSAEGGSPEEEMRCGREARGRSRADLDTLCRVKATQKGHLRRDATYRKCPELASPRTDRGGGSGRRGQGWGQGGDARGCGRGFLCAGVQSFENQAMLVRAPPCGRTKNHRVAHLEMVTSLVCEFHLSLQKGLSVPRS